MKILHRLRQVCHCLTSRELHGLTGHQRCFVVCPHFFSASAIFPGQETFPIYSAPCQRLLECSQSSWPWSLPSFSGCSHGGIPGWLPVECISFPCSVEWYSMNSLPIASLWFDTQPAKLLAFRGGTSCLWGLLTGVQSDKGCDLYKTPRWEWKSNNSEGSGSNSLLSAENSCSSTVSHTHAGYRKLSGRLSTFLVTGFDGLAVESFLQCARKLTSQKVYHHIWKAYFASCEHWKAVLASSP